MMNKLMLALAIVSTGAMAEDMPTQAEFEALKYRYTYQCGYMMGAVKGALSVKDTMKDAHPELFDRWWASVQDMQAQLELCKQEPYVKQAMQQ